MISAVAAKKMIMAYLQRFAFTETLDAIEDPEQEEVRIELARKMTLDEEADSEQIVELSQQEEDSFATAEEGEGSTSTLNLTDIKLFRHKSTVVQEYVSDLLKDYVDDAPDDELFHSPVGKIKGNYLPFGALAATQPETMDVMRMVRSKSNVHDVRENAKM